MTFVSYCGEIRIWWEQTWQQVDVIFLSMHLCGFNDWCEPSIFLAWSNYWMFQVMLHCRAVILLLFSRSPHPPPNKKVIKPFAVAAVFFLVVKLCNRILPLNSTTWAPVHHALRTGSLLSLIHSACTPPLLSSALEEPRGAQRCMCEVHIKTIHAW